MQRFVVKKAPNAPTNVKFSGYLKKKREKLGGWKKMWFVLQNQLLLSYNSKEEYEGSLAPFKDVVSLVPGTNIIPMQDNKFTIETATKTLYTFVSTRLGGMESAKVFLKILTLTSFFSAVTTQKHALNG